MSRIKRVGIELEVFSDLEASATLPIVYDGLWMDDAGLNLLEMITSPQDSVSKAFKVLRKLVARCDKELYFVSSRPPHLRHNSGRWQPKLYEAVLTALRRESPHHWSDVHQMTNAAALQINISGEFDPFGVDGVFLINVFNNIAPHLAAVVHRDIESGRGHLAIWQRFARIERLPQAERWFQSPRAMISYMESIPKLVQRTEAGSLVVDLHEPVQASNADDLSKFWWFLRAKMGDSGPYLEYRCLPAMNLADGEHYSNLLVNMTEVLLEWFHGFNHDRAVATAQDARPAYLLARQQFPRYMPEGPISRKHWLRLLYR